MLLFVRIIGANDCKQILEACLKIGIGFEEKIIDVLEFTIVSIIEVIGLATAPDFARRRFLFFSQSLRDVNEAGFAVIVSMLNGDDALFQLARVFNFHVANGGRHRITRQDQHKVIGFGDAFFNFVPPRLRGWDGLPIDPDFLFLSC